jgi:hypothetical protein
MKNIKNVTHVIIIAWLSLLLMLTISCREYVRLTPASEAQEVDEINHAATSTIAGVTILVQARSWEGTTAIKSEVTPLRVTIENNSQSPIRVRYSDIALVTAAGDHFAALPPYAIEGTIEEPVRVEPHVGHPAPRFEHDGFMVAPYYSHLYGGIAPFDGAFFYDPFYYDRYFTYWQEIELPTIEMLQQALPDGVINPGGKVSGFIYFEPVTSGIPRVNFVMDLADAREGDILGTINIPFLVR